MYLGAKHELIYNYIAANSQQTNLAIQENIGIPRVSLDKYIYALEKAGAIIGKKQQTRKCREWSVNTEFDMSNFNKPRIKKPYSARETGTSGTQLTSTGLIHRCLNQPARPSIDTQKPIRAKYMQSSLVSIF